MNFKLKFILGVIIFFSASFILAQKNVYFDFSENKIKERLKEDITTLASEEMEGREAGTEGERLAVEYIKSRFKEISLEPVFGESYFQYFNFHGEWKYTEDNKLKIGEKKFITGEDYFPMVQSGNVSIASNPVYVGYGLKKNELEWNDYEDFDDLSEQVLVIEYYLPDSIYEKLDISVDESLHKKFEAAKKHEPGGIVFVNSLRPDDDPYIDLRDRTERMDIPVVFAGNQVYEKLNKHDFDINMALQVELKSEEFTGTNVAGYIDNEANKTVVIGAHHDHLGYGGPTSRYIGEPKIHYGADDNASGVAGVLETARYIKEQDFNDNNYLFITFSAEEKGLIGSRHFTESNAYDMNKINYMFNFDMIGRMENNELVMIGTGTSPVWEKIIPETQPDHFNIRKVASGIGGSDHTSFYLKDIPVIFFFTGIHRDYHKPYDTHDKINYQGQKEILSYAWDLIAQLDKMERLDFTETRTDQPRRRRGNDITMGIMPDHAFDGDGLKVQKVLDDRPAYKAGVKDGDVIIALGEHEIKEIHAYMRALEKFEEGDKVKVIVLREDKEIELSIEF